jgi:Flp pilus assembly protein TadG
VGAESRILKKIEMKNIKLILASFFLIAIIGCEEDERSTQFIDNAAAPSEVLLQFRTTQDNSGLVTMTPNAVGATKFDIAFGDGTGNAVELEVGETIDNVYGEGTYTVGVTATSVNGLTTQVEQQLIVSFEAPQNLLVTVENDAAISRRVNVTATADFAMSYEVDFGQAGSDPISGNIGETVPFIYEEAGTYTITVVAMGAAIETATFVEENFEVTEILAPIASADTPPGRADTDVIAVFSEAYTYNVDTDFFPFWDQNNEGYAAGEFDLDGDLMLQYTNLSYQGINLAEAIDASSMETLHIDIWTPDDISIDIFPLPNGIAPADEKFVTRELVANQWNSFDIPLEEFTSQGLALDDLLQFKFTGTPSGEGTVFIDNLYFHKAPTGPPPFVGTWKISPEPGSLGVGPALGDTQWFSCDANCVIERACLYDDTYVFSSDGSFTNNLGSETWIEPWQGGNDACGAPVAPYDGSAVASFTYDEVAGQVTINGAGAYLGIPKANNEGELPNVAVPNSITYNITLSENNTVMDVYVESGAGVFWQYKLVLDSQPSPLEGSWSLSQEEGSLGVGPALGDTQWFSCDAACVTERACLYDDTYVFGSDGAFTNVLGTETWIEPWQDGADACGAPVAPYDGSAIANFVYDEVAGTLTINGTGAYLGIPKANNEGELPNVAVPDAITYNVTLSENDTVMDAYVESGAGVFWQYKLVKN